MDITNKIALVTGGANGIGFAYAEELLRNGAAHVAILDLANSKGEEAAEKLNKEFGKGRAIFIVCDVTNPQQLEDGFAKVVKEFGGLDIVINNAGIMDDSRWELMININYTALVRGTLLSFKYMGKDQGGKGGTIVNIASIVGLVPSAVFPIYSGTKHAVVGLSRSFADPIHYERTGVRIITMCPSATETQLITKSVGRMLEFIDESILVGALNTLPMQTAESVARGVIQIIKVGENGSVWVTEDGKEAYKVDIPNFNIMGA